MLMVLRYETGRSMVKRGKLTSSKQHFSLKFLMLWIAIGGYCRCCPDRQGEQNIPLPAACYLLSLGFFWFVGFLI